MYSLEIHISLKCHLSFQKESVLREVLFASFMLLFIFQAEL